MPRLHKRLKDRQCRNAGPGMHADGDGLYLQVTDSHSRSWILRTMVLGSRRDMGLGAFPSVSLEEAREHAERFRKIARKGGNPILERDKERQTKQPPTFEEAARTVHQEHLPSWKNPKHADQWINTLIEYVFPHFGNKPVNQIESADCLRALSPIWLTKPETARRVRQRIRAVLDWSKAAGHRTGDNPIEGISKGLPKQRDSVKHHEACPYKDVPAFISTLRKSEATESAKLAFEFLILTATRTNEVLEAQWDEIDTDKAVWTIPAYRMKAKKEHAVPLSARCLEILHEARKLSPDNPYIFAGRGVHKPLSNMALLMLVRRMKANITVHGFRSSFRDWTAEKTSFERAVCEAALAHVVSNDTEAAYLRTTLFDKRRDMMATWADFVANKSAKVVQLRQKAG